MSEKENPVLSKKVIATLALAALMSIFLAKFFSELAFADGDPVVHAMPTLNDPGRNLGTYRVTDIIDHARFHEGSACQPYRDSHGEQNPPDDECGQYVWIARTDNQVAMLKMPGSPDQDANLETFMLYGSLIDPKCDSSITSSDAQTGLFTSRLCRAFHVKRLDTRKNEVFLFNNGMDPTARAMEGSMLSLAITGVPLGVGDQYSIAIPRNQTVPDRIVVTKTVSGSFLLFINTSFTKDYILQRVAE